MAHDFCPGSEYELQDLTIVEGLTSSEVERLGKMIKSVQEQLEPAFGFEAPCEIFLSEDVGGLAVFCNGTSSRPCLGLDLAQIKRVSEQEGLGFIHQAEISLANVMAHAYLETLGADYDAARGELSSAAEEFARDWADYRDIDLTMLKDAALQNVSEVPGRG